MYYINRKVGRKFEVIDTEDGVAELYTKKALREFTDEGININGTCKIGSKFAVIPVGSLINLDSRGMAKNKLIRGTCTGIVGFDLDIKEDEILALPLDTKFYEYARDSLNESIYILHIPDGVTKIDKQFLKNLNNTQLNDLRLCFELPLTVSSICCSSFSSWRVSKIKFGCEVIDKIYNEDLSHYYISIRSLTDNETLRVREIEGRCIDIYDIQRLILPDIVDLGNDCMRKIYNRSITEFYLGKDITYLGDFCHNVMKTVKNSDNYKSTEELEYLNESYLTRYANIVYIPDNCNIRELNFVSSTLYKKPSFATLHKPLEPSVYGTYILVCSESEFRSLRGCLSEDLISTQVAIGILTYKDDKDLKDIQTHIREYCKDYKNHINNYFTKDSLGYATLMSLKNRFDVD